MHRFYWDLHYGPAPDPQSIPMQAILHDTAAEPKGPWAMPGHYTVRLTVAGQSQEVPLEVRMDPRVTTSTEDLQMQFDMAKSSWDSAARAQVIRGEISGVREQIKGARAKATGDEAKRLDDLDKKLEDLLGGGGGRRRSRFGGGLADAFGGVFGSVEGADLRPTITVQETYKGLVKQMADLESAWAEIKAHDLSGFTVPEIATPAVPFATEENEEEP